MKSAFLITVALGALCVGGAASAASMHTQVFTTSGTFTVPAGATTSQEFLFTVVGGGGGGGGCASDTIFVGGGGAGANGFASFTGFSASDTVTIAVGGGGTGGGGNGGTGGTSKATYSSVDIAAATGGTGGHGGTVTPGAAGSFSATAGASGLTLKASYDYGAQDGEALASSADAGQATMTGGSNAFGSAGTLTHIAGTTGGGGLGCPANPSTGGAGGSGVVIVTWVQ